MTPAPRIRLDSSLIARLVEASAAARWALPREAFEAALGEAAVRAFGMAAVPGRDEQERWAASLPLEDMALAAACALGSAPAWEHFVAEYQPVLRRAADAMDRTGNGRDLADALIADLYGMPGKDGERRSLFRYFHGRSRLATWLRAVLAQRMVDRARAARRVEPLPERVDELARPTEEPDPDRARFQPMVEQACAAAIASLDPRDRLRLSCYYGQGMTLAAIGRMLLEHEATVSRHLSRTRTAIRDAVDARLRADHGLDDRAVAECFRAVTADPGSIDLSTLLGAPAARKVAAAARSEE